MSAIQAKFGDYDFTDTLKSWSEETPGELQTAEALERDGVLAGDTYFLGVKLIRVSGMIAGAGAAALRDSVDAMAAAFKAGRQKLNLFDDRFTYAQNSAFDYNFAEGAGMSVVAYSAQFLADEPYWDSEALSTSTVTDATNSSFTVVNGGNAAAYPVITIEAQSTTAYLKFENSTRGESFEYNGTLDAGDTLVVDCFGHTVTKNGSNDIGNFTNDFPRIAPGTNAITYTGPTNEVQVAWRDRWY